MRFKETPFWVLAALVTSHATVAAAAPTGVDPEALAHKLANQCAAVHENDIVLISGGVRDLELLENLAVHARKVGAFPLVTIGSERMIRRMYDDVPARYDSQRPELDLKLAEIITVAISVDIDETEGLLAHVPPPRLAATAEAAQPVGRRIYERSVRQVNLGNGLYPTATLAKRFGMSQEELARIFWDGVNVDYAKLQSTGETVRTALAAGKEVHITNPNGTDLKVRVEGRPILVSDGVVSTEEAMKGGPACQTWLPAGEVYLAPVHGTAEGKVVVDRQAFQGKEIEGLTLAFKAGKLVSMTAKSGIEPLKALYDASGEGKDLFAAIDLGINPNVRIVPGSRMQAWMSAGMVTVGFGNNTWAGGDNDSSFGLFGFLPGSTVKVDGKVLVESGKLLL